MTLILIALCKNGICVCADRRYKIRDSNGLVRFEDNHNKIFKFEKIPFLVLNHGVNSIKNKDWRAYCSEYEESDRWNGKDQFQITNDFKSFVESDVVEELNTHNNGEKYAVGFLLCGKTPLDSKFKINELFWLIDSDGIKFEILRHRCFVKTGDSKKYLDFFLKNNPEINTEKYWKGLDPTKTKRELIKVFNVAVDEKKRLNGDDFSNEFDIEGIY
jgi:hypothetical protein